ncbi:hypothetical protein [Solirubrum puertoriconensis]|uniref:Uncharacterized protein n=1 Tax=Solirubrum puertoriconensis TaxID=1751427 RepID=A0A9X0L3V1_SOLP1|nr:hypothetical protein [Solirubrum puertoriconensis]KUG06890.1 hypothetical protein ASU33_06075 [Solirubrum puertoriconensis]
MLASAKVAFAQSMPELVQASIEALRQHPQPPYGRPAQASGRTAQLIREEHGDDFGAVYGPAHAQTLITGRGPTRGGGNAGGEPLRAILAQWAQDKGIQLTGGMTYQQFGFLAARKIHRAGTALHRLGQPSRLFSDILTPDRLNTLKARIAAGQMVAIATELRHALSQ